MWAEVRDFCSKVLDSISPIIAARATSRLQPAIPDLRVVLNRLRLPSRPHREHGALIQLSMRNVLKIFRWAWILVFFCVGLHSQVESRNRRPSSVPTRSRSGQFIVLGESSIKEDLSRNSVLVPGGPQRTVSLTPLRPMDSQGIANLTPALLSVSCERIKGELLRVLKIEDRLESKHGGAIGGREIFGLEEGGVGLAEKRGMREMLKITSPLFGKSGLVAEKGGCLAGEGGQEG